MVGKILRALLIAVYAVLALFGFLSGMFSEGLISSVHPWATVLTDAMVWQGLTISLSAVVCPLMSMRLKEKPALKGVVLAIPFLLLAVQIVLNDIADML